MSLRLRKMSLSIWKKNFTTDEDAFYRRDKVYYRTSPNIAGYKYVVKNLLMKLLVKCVLALLSYSKKRHMFLEVIA